MYRVAQIQELEQRIKSHTAQMAERRRKPKGTPQEEMEAARRDLEIVSKLLAFLFFFQNLHQTSNPMCQHLVCVDLYSVISVLWSDASQNLCGNPFITFILGQIVEERWRMSVNNEWFF